MRTVYAAVCFSALALITGCQSHNPQGSVVEPPAPPSNFASLRLGPPPTDYKPELGLEGQRSDKQIAISIDTYKVSPQWLMSQKISWANLKEGTKLGSKSLATDLISPEAGLKLRAFKVDGAFARGSLPSYLQKQGKTTLAASSTTFSMDGIVTPFAASNSKGYLSQLQCSHGDVISLVPGSSKRSHEFVLTPEIVSDKLVFLSVQARAVTSASEPSTCNDKHEPDDLIEVSEGSLYGVSAYLSQNDALVISGIQDAETEKDGSVKVVVIVAQEILPVVAAKK